jgi:hypothetical protein
MSGTAIPIDDDTIKQQALIPAPMRNATGVAPQRPIPTEAPSMPVVRPNLVNSPDVGTPIPTRPVLAQQGKPIPTGRVPNIQGTIDPQSGLYHTPPPNQPGVASLWSKAENIHNPILRVLGEIGAGGARALDTVGTIVAPRVAAAIPGTTLNKKAQVAGEEAQATQGVENKLKEAETENQKSEAENRGAPKEEEAGKTVTTDDGIFQWNPETKAYDKRVGDAPGKQEVQGKTVVTDQGVMQWNPDTKHYDIPVGNAPPKPVTPEMDKHEAYQKYLKEQGVDDTYRSRINFEKEWADAVQKPERPGVGDARADKSYQLQSSRLDKIRTPVSQLNQRLGRLNDTLNQQNPQADALIGPELLSVMAGGVGSGVRMNEAEIARIVGGRSAWENLKANLQHWSTNPKDARSITPEQDKQIRSLVSAVQSKLVMKQDLLDRAEENLVGSDDPKQHRQIVVDTQKNLDAIDAGKFLTAEGLQKAATENKISVDEARKQAEKQGYYVQ